MPDEVLVERRGSVMVITLNRPENLNAQSRSMLHDLASAVHELNQDSALSVGIITGAGRAFCAGGDLKEMAADSAAGTWDHMPRQPDIAGVAASEKPVIAAVNGLAVGGGLELSACCDIRVASSSAWFAAPEGSRGILAGIAVTTLARLMPIGAVMDLLLSGDRMTADDAFRLGFVQKLTRPEDLMDVALERAELIANQSPSAVLGTKAVVKFWRDAMLAEQQRYFEAVMHRVFLSGDFQEGPTAFAEKREPLFSSSWPSPFERRT